MLKHILLSAAALGCCGPLAAQDSGPKFDLTASLLGAQNSLKKVTHQDLAYGLGLGVKFILPKVEVPMKVGLATYDMPGKQSGTIKSSLKLTQFYTDFYLTSTLPAWSVKFGFSANKYRVSNSGTETWVTDPTNPGGFMPESAWAVTQDKGLKLGYRLGVDYNWSKHWGAELLFQLTELSGGEGKTIMVDGWYGPEAKLLPNTGAVNPSWLQLGVRYTF
jgi:hypothetical protein